MGKLDLTKKPTDDRPSNDDLTAVSKGIAEKKAT